MARRKNAPESVKVKHGLAERLREIRTELFGERGGPDLARRLEIPVRTWYNYETGVTVPAEIILRIVELTSVEPIWLLRGEGPRFRTKETEDVLLSSSQSLAATPIPALLRAALRRLEQAEMAPRNASVATLRATNRALRPSEVEVAVPALIAADRVGQNPLTPADGTPYHHALHEWEDAQKTSHRLRVTDDHMAPIIAEGAIVNYTEAEAVTEALDGKLVVARVDDEDIVRWFQHCGRYGLLRAENPATVPPTILVDLSAAEDLAYHRVSWICTPHI